MNHLSGIDATFLYLETPEMPMHVGSLNIYDLPEGYKGEFWEDVKAHVASRMHLAPFFSRKLALMPFELADPVWVDDDDIDLDYHIRRVVLPKPGTMQQLEAYIGRLHSSLLDRSRPLWEFYVIEGLQTGQMAFYSKAHHAGLDGAAGVAVSAAILDLTETPRTVRPPPRHRPTAGYQLGVAELAGAALKNTAMQYLKLVKLIPAVAKVAAKIALPPKDENGVRARRLPKGSLLGPKTPFNVAITNQRVFATQSLPLVDAKRIAKRMGVTLNDVVMAVCSAALRRYLEERDGVPKKPLLAGIPVSLREAGNTDNNNQAMTMTVSLATHVADPLARLQAIHESSGDAKAITGNIRSAVPMDFPSFGAPWLVTGMVSLIGRTKLVNAMPPVNNLVISNVPGPQVPLYLAGAKMATNFPVSIPAHGMALNITVQSYNGSLDFGLTACRRAVPDVADIAVYLRDAMTELKAAVAALEPLAVAVAVSTAPEPVAAKKLPRKRSAATAVKAVKPAPSAGRPKTMTPAVRRSNGRAAKATAA